MRLRRVAGSWIVSWAFLLGCASYQIAAAFLVVPSGEVFTHSSRNKVIRIAVPELNMVMHHPDDMLLPRAQDALVSPQLARDLRRVRSSRGLALLHELYQKEQKKRLLTSDNTKNVQARRRIERERQDGETVGRWLGRKEPSKVPTTSTGRTRHGMGDPAPTSSLRRTNGVDLPYETTVQALRVYRNLHGSLVMPRRYIVPSRGNFPTMWVGVDLASSVYNMKWWQSHVKGRPERVSELNELGFVWERLQPAWNIVLEALVYYHSIHGNVLVSNKFVVPHGDKLWPKATWGIPLGNYVRSIRSRHDFLHGPNSLSRRRQLESLGFVWDVHEQRFLKFYDVLTHFAKLRGCGVFSASGRPKPLRVPSTFVVPEEKEVWPEEFWGFPLGEKCTAVRQKHLYVKNNPERQQMLEELGFRWSGNANLAWLKVVHAAAIYSKLHNRTLSVPNNFVVPEAPRHFLAAEDWPWPEHLWGVPLGQRLKEIRVNGIYLKGKDGPQRRRQLDALGFIWNTSEHRFQVFYAALQHYAQLNKSGVYSGKGKPKKLQVPSTFTVPSGDDAWPSQLWEFDLGKKCAGVRSQKLYVKKHPDRLKKLERLGFDISDE